MAAEVADVIVVGLGPGGEDLTGRLAQAGLHVIGIEQQLVGGECPYWGCVPTKMMIRAADSLAEGRRIPELAGSSHVDPDWAPVARRIRDEATDNWDDRVAVERLEGKGAQVVRGRAHVVSPRAVEVDGQRYEATRGLVLAAGTRATIPPVDGLAATPYWTNRQAVETEQLPESLTVLGGGAIGLEFAQLFARFGTQVTVLEAADRILPPEEPQASQLLTEVLTREGIQVRSGARLTRVDHDGQRFTIQLQDGETVTSQQLLVATGRRPDLAGLGVSAAGLDENARALTVDDRLRAADGVWAIGDITEPGGFTHVATYQARIAAADILGQAHPPASYHALPRVTFTDPEVGAVGMTEAQARAAGLTVATGITQIPASSRGWIHKVGNDGFIKLVADAEQAVLVGATSAGPNGGEVLGALAVAVHARVPLATLSSMIYAYPTFHRAIEDALSTLNLPSTKL